MLALYIMGLALRTVLFFGIWLAIDLFAPASARFPSNVSSLIVAFLLASWSAMENLKSDAPTTWLRRIMIGVTVMSVALWLSVGVLDWVGPNRSPNTLIGGVVGWFIFFGPGLLRARRHERQRRRANIRGGAP